MNRAKLHENDRFLLTEDTFRDVYVLIDWFDDQGYPPTEPMSPHLMVWQGDEWVIRKTFAPGMVEQLLEIEITDDELFSSFEDAWRWVEIKADVRNWLYYETGFEQLHPITAIHEWMDEQGLEYDKDWNVVRRGKDYYIQFPDDETKLLFLLRWGEGDRAR